MELEEATKKWEDYFKPNEQLAEEEKQQAWLKSIEFQIYNLEKRIEALSDEASLVSHQKYLKERWTTKLWKAKENLLKSKEKLFK